MPHYKELDQADVEMVATPTPHLDALPKAEVSSKQPNLLVQGTENSPPSVSSVTSPPKEEVPSIPHFAENNTLNNGRPLGPRRIFLDICAGATRPLSQACLRQGKCVLSFDILIHLQMDLLDNIEYEQLLRLCSSGSVAYAGASPSCGQYSRLAILELKTHDVL